MASQTEGKIRGILEVWTDKQYGFIKVASTDGIVTKFFLHKKNIVGGRPQVGAIVQFHVANQGGKLPSAINAEIIQFDPEFLKQQHAFKILAGLVPVTLVIS
jgi:hypothetical protein